MVADVQALTDNFDNPEKVRENVIEVALDNLAVGVDPNKSTLFIQSQIPEIAELTVFYSNLVTVSELQRNPTVKEEIKSKGHIFKDGNVTFGFLGYPVSQAADITFCRANVVPVGEDQKPMIELTRHLVRKFNDYYGVIFPEPKEIISAIPRLTGLDGRKMSKSFDNAIYLSDTLTEIKSKVSRAKTDTDNKIIYDLETKPDISNLITYYQIATNLTHHEIEQKFSKVSSYKIFKDELVTALDNFLTQFRDKRNSISKQDVLDILIEGTQRTRIEAKTTMALVKEAMKINYFD